MLSKLFKKSFVIDNNENIEYIENIEYKENNKNIENIENKENKENKTEIIDFDLFTENIENKENKENIDNKNTKEGIMYLRYINDYDLEHFYNNIYSERLNKFGQYSIIYKEELENNDNIKNNDNIENKDNIDKKIIKIYWNSYYKRGEIVEKTMKELEEETIKSVRINGIKLEEVIKMLLN
jgi:hypothetical protein